uniref:Integrase catalytic domain-containing protein n=1 Tax=Tanacetum cinerariifolium TaxID=118510 RepID=A0A699I375_TANCI|nr:hypothetical protein [Tanacetum cinerariifolium]
MDYDFFYDKVPIYCDSESAIAISCNPVHHTRTKHIDVRYHFIKDHVEKGTIELYFVGLLKIQVAQKKVKIAFENVDSSSRVELIPSNIKAKLSLDSALLWHYRLGHINKKRIEKLQHDGLVDSTDIKSFEKCVACMSGKMARKPYSHQVERAKDLLGLIHTDDHGIIAYRNPPYTPQHNEVSKRRNRTLLDMVRSMMSQTTLLKSFWDYALESAVRNLNMVPTKKGYEALVKRDTLTKPDILEPRSIKCIFVGYPKEMIGYSFYYPPENKVFVARNAEFLKNSIMTQKASRSLKDLEIIQEQDTHPSLDTSLDHEKDDQEIDEPQSDINPIRSSSKRRPTWMELYTPIACMVAKGLTQTPGIDYEETFSHVANIRAIRILIAIAVFYDYEIWQMYVKTSFLNRYLNKEIYMVQPEGDAHWTAVKNILKYLRNTRDMFLVYEGNMKRELRVSCYTDFGYLTYADDMKSQTGYVFVLNGEAVWIRKFISGLGVFPIIKEPINMYCNNTGAIEIAKDHGVTKGARHFRVKVHYLRETIEIGDVRIEKVDTYDNLADLFTKALAFPKHSELTKKIGMIPTSSLT